MIERSEVYSSHFKRKHNIAGHNVHLEATMKPKLTWFVYLMECIHQHGIYQYAGSTCSMTDRWANTKSKCLKGTCEGTGLDKHYKDGCQNANNIRITLLEQYNTTNEALHAANHKQRPGCICQECEKLKELESKWIHRLGTLHGEYGLNSRSELNSQVRAKY